ncbi:WXG100 family type VII secretion target [Kitasatospora sp. NPDC052896]|uniref:WXG100 family type VII secretion target n=1 Tax=Kitasatospora sp. NPDC052896 TaxID=3364061 RepID=UPI0037CC1A18
MPDGAWDSKAINAGADDRAAAKAQKHRAKLLREARAKPANRAPKPDSCFTNLRLDQLKALIENADPGQVETIAGHWDNVHDALIGPGGISDQLNSAVSRTLTTWTGPAADAFATEAASIATQLTNGAGYVANTSKALKGAADSLRQAQGAIAAIHTPSEAANVMHAMTTRYDDRQLTKDLANPEIDTATALELNRGTLSLGRQQELRAAVVLEGLASSYKGWQEVLGSLPYVDNSATTIPPAPAFSSPSEVAFPSSGVGNSISRFEGRRAVAGESRGSAGERKLLQPSRNDHGFYGSMLVSSASKGNGAGLSDGLGLELGTVPEKSSPVAISSGGPASLLGAISPGISGDSSAARESDGYLADSSGGIYGSSEVSADKFIESGLDRAEEATVSSWSEESSGVTFRGEEGVGDDPRFAIVTGRSMGLPGIDGATSAPGDHDPTIRDPVADPGLHGGQSGGYGIGGNGIAPGMPGGGRRKNRRVGGENCPSYLVEDREKWLPKLETIPPVIK